MSSRPLGWFQLVASPCAPPTAEPPTATMLRSPSSLPWPPGPALTQPLPSHAQPLACSLSSDSTSLPSVSRQVGGGVALGCHPSL